MRGIGMGEQTSPEKRRGCRGCLLPLTAAGAILVGAPVVNHFMDRPPATAHSVHEIPWPGTDKKTTMTYDRNGSVASFVSDYPNFAIRLVCGPKNVGTWTAEASVLGKKLKGDFDVVSNENTFSPCVKKGMVNPSYDKAAAGHFIDLTEDMLRSRTFWLVKKILPNPPFMS